VTLALGFVTLLGVAVALTMVALRYGDLEGVWKRVSGGFAVARNVPTDPDMDLVNFVGQGLMAPRTRQHGSGKEIWIKGFLFPFVLFVSCVLIWSFVQNHLLLAVFQAPACSMLLVFCLTPSKFGYGLFTTIIIAVGATVGDNNYENNLQLYFAVDRHQSYINVDPEANVTKYTDAGQLVFADSAYLSTETSVGFQVQGTTYCAAPVLGNSTTPDRVEFWAVGTDCCDARGGFRCDDAGSDAKKGVVVRTQHLLFCEQGDRNESTNDRFCEEARAKDTLRDHYLKAVSSVVEVYNITAPSQPVLLVWSATGTSPQDRWLLQGVGVVLLYTVLAFITLCAGSLILSCRASFAQSKAKASAQAHRERTTETVGQRDHDLSQAPGRQPGSWKSSGSSSSLQSKSSDHEWQ